MTTRYYTHAQCVNRRGRFPRAAVAGMPWHSTQHTPAAYNTVAPSNGSAWQSIRLPQAMRRSAFLLAPVCYHLPAVTVLHYSRTELAVRELKLVVQVEACTSEAAAPVEVCTSEEAAPAAVDDSPSAPSSSWEGVARLPAAKAAASHAACF